MKTITVNFYSCANLGDDLFVKTLAQQFHDCQIQLIANPRCIPENLGSNVHIHPHTFSSLLFRKLQSVFGEMSRVGMLADRMNEACFRTAANASDAYVYVGGSLFMQHTPGLEPIRFDAEEPPVFGVLGRPQDNGNRFVIGANLGPAYRETYWEQIREILKGYTHVSLRDWASYCQIRDLRHVQYAPDVLFLVPQPPVVSQGENVVISVVEMENHTEDPAVTEAYYQLLADAAIAFSERKIPVTMVSFCEWQGDTRAIEKVKARMPDGKWVKTVCYKKDMQEVLNVIAGASYVIASRFHSMILGVSYGKPVFPIAYNCKTEHYLQDLAFAGKTADLKTMTGLSVEDLLYNYDHRILTDCTDHKIHARDQFRALREFLEQETVKT